MIFVQRTDQPKVLITNALNWTTEYLAARDNLLADPSEANKKIVSGIEKRYNQQEVKDALKFMFNRKCAFCESTVTHISYGEIEHFKPKSKFPDLCFNWDNFLLSCTVCNGTANKGNKFPSSAEGGPFINPTVENPEDFFTFDYDDKLNRFIVFPKNLRGKTMLQIIKLNREDLVEHRTQILWKILYYLKTIVKKDPALLEEFEKLFSKEDEYLSFVRTMIAKVKSNL